MGRHSLSSYPNLSTQRTSMYAGSDLRNLAAYFSMLSPAQGDKSSSAAILRGSRLFLGGDPSRGVPRCQCCHDTTAQGHPHTADPARYCTYPILAGQHAPFLVQRLNDFRNGKRGLTSNARLMAGVVRNLDPTGIKDLAAWLESMP